MPLNRTFSFDDGEEGPLNQTAQHHFSPYHDHSPQRRRYHDSSPSPTRDITSPPPAYNPPESPTRPARYHPAAHPDSAYNRFSRQSYQSVENQLRSQPIEPTDSTLDAAPRPPPHRRLPSGQTANDGRLWGREIGYTPSAMNTDSNVTQGVDSFGDRAEGGGLGNIAYDVASRNPRESGVEASRAMEAVSGQPYQDLMGRMYSHNSSSSYDPSSASQGIYPRQENSNSSANPFATPAVTPGSVTPGATSLENVDTHYSAHSIPLNSYPSSSYHDSPYMHSSFNNVPQLSAADIDPRDIADDGDDGFMPDPRRRSMLALGRSPSRDVLPTAAGAGAAGAASSGLKGAVGSILGKGKKKNQTASGNYDPVGRAGNAEGGNSGVSQGEKSEWLSRQREGNNKMRWVVGFAIGTVVILAIIGGIVGGVLGTKRSSSSSGSSGGSSSSNGVPAWNSTNNAQTDLEVNGDLNKDSDQIKALMNNKDLHKVFPGIDYTPWGTQYPDCLKYPPSQNNVTRDMAVLSQLTNAVRLYGTDCNQTEMVLHSIDRLGLTDMKVWLGVWIDTNDTTTKRQMDQMYKLLGDVKDLSIFKGAIIGNEALYRAGVDKATSEQQLIDQLKDVRNQFDSHGWKLPVATSDLGDNWNGQLVDVVDMVMSNIHPFFAGVTADKAAGWTFDFWDQHDVVLTKGTSKQQIISETGWPSGGGNDCGSDTVPCQSATEGSIAGVDEMNTFMGDWICQALGNGTEYFWFEAFDEPWKVRYNEPGKEWEDKWGLMDPARQLKPGLNIPACGGKTVP